jgi:hypothetical protein
MASSPEIFRIIHADRHLCRYLVFALSLELEGPTPGLIVAGSVTIAVAYTVSIVLCFWGRQAFLLDCVFM